MQNEKVSALTKSKTLSKNVISNNIAELNKDQANDLTTKIDSKINKKRRPSILSPKRRKKKKQNQNIVVIHRLFKSDIFFKNEKVKSKFINCFNIKEQIILMDVNSVFYENITSSECFKKYLKIRNEFILKEDIYQKILLSNNDETINNTLKTKKTQKNNTITSIGNIKNKSNKNQVDKVNAINNNTKISQSRVYHEKFRGKGIKSPVKMGLNNVLTIYPTLAGEKDRDDKEEELKKKKNLCHYENKNIIQKVFIIREQKKAMFQNPLDFKKLDLNLLLKNNAEKIKKLIKKYDLSQTESKIIFNGIIEHLIFLNDLNDSNEQHPIIIQNLKASAGFSYFVESLLNLDFEEIAKINFNNVLLNSMQVMKTLGFLFHKYSHCLRILILPNNKIDDKCSKILFPSLQENKMLSLLDLSNNCISNEGIAFSELFFIDNRLTNIVLFDNNLIGPIGVFSLCSFLRNNQKINIELLDLGYNGITKEGVNHLVNYIKNNRNKISTLYLGGNYICDDGLEILSSLFIRENKNIENDIKIVVNTNNSRENNDTSNLNNSNLLNNTNNKDLNNTASGDVKNNNSLINNNNTNSANNNSLFVDNNNKITFLDIQNNNLTKKSCNYINNIILANNTEITHLIVSNNDLGNDGIIKVLSSIKVNNKLLSLDLSETKIDEKVIKYLAEILDEDCVLEKILLSKNNLRKACVHIKNLLIKKTNIKYLKLTSCKIEDSFNLIFKGLADNNMLQILDLSDNNFSLRQELFKDIIDVLSSNKTLCKLKLNETNIDDFAIEYLSKGLENNGGLREIYLKKNYLTKKSVSMLLKAIENNSIIAKIELVGNEEISNKLIQEVEKVLQNKKECASELNSDLDMSILDSNKKYDDDLRD
jgi:Ran GTPase-activating protein (RanGAP) involved in mRNA processing and transport